MLKPVYAVDPTLLDVSGTSKHISQFSRGLQALLCYLTEVPFCNVPAAHAGCLHLSAGSSVLLAVSMLTSSFLCLLQGLIRPHENLARHSLIVMQRIYIALPEEKARAHMFKVHLGDTPHDLQPQDFQELAQHTEGFSGSDVAVVVKDVLMEPVRLTQDAGYFRCMSAACLRLSHSRTVLSCTHTGVCCPNRVAPSCNLAVYCWTPSRSGMPIVQCVQPWSAGLAACLLLQLQFHRPENQ